MCIRDSENSATYAAKMSVVDGIIDWDNSATSIVCKFRACNPWPVAHSWLQGRRIRIWEARVCENDSQNDAPGMVVSSTRTQVMVSARQGTVCLRIVQKDGRNRMPIRDFLAGNPIAEGSKFTQNEVPVFN